MKIKTKLQRFFIGIFVALLSFIGVSQVQAAETGTQALDRVKTVLCPDNKPVGKPQGQDATITVVSVSDFSDAYTYLIKICPAKELQKETKGDYIFYTYTLPDGAGSIVLHDKVNSGKREVAVMELAIAEFKNTLQKIVFIKK
ncbi:MAG: hypothetical protein LBK47_06865 [Prevotellaceae bacterium]|jgi:hypothetical protein|nr:hypothetical protein [Prevotellaceae bacterium]